MIRWFLTLLTVLFIGLKLTGFIDWSWFAVLMPILALPALALMLFCLIGLREYRRECRRSRLPENAGK